MAGSMTSTSWWLSYSSSYYSQDSQLTIHTPPALSALGHVCPSHERARPLYGCDSELAPERTNRFLLGQISWHLLSTCSPQTRRCPRIRIGTQPSSAGTPPPAVPCPPPPAAGTSVTSCRSFT